MKHQIIISFLLNLFVTSCQTNIEEKTHERDVNLVCTLAFSINDEPQKFIHYLSYCPDFDGYGSKFSLIDACHKYLDTCTKDLPVETVIFVDCDKAREFEAGEPNYAKLQNEKSISFDLERNRIKSIRVRLDKSVDVIDITADSIFIDEFENLAH